MNGMEFTEAPKVKETVKISDESEKTKEIVGTPEEDIELWHRQEHPMSCAVACQEFVAEELLKEQFSEACGNTVWSNEIN